MRYKLLILGLVLVVGFSLAGLENISFAQTDQAPPPDVGILPTSPFYFLKEWSRGLQLFFTFNPVAKAKLELKFAQERAEEIEVLKEEKEIKGIEKAIENYERNIERLKSRLEFLKETSANPNIDVLLTDLTERVVQHQQLFEELKVKFSELERKIETVQEAIDESFSRGLEKLDLPEKAIGRLEKVFDKIDHPLSEIESLNLVSRLENKITNKEIKDKLLKLEEKMVSKFEGKVKAGEIVLPELNRQIKELLPDEETKIEILDTLREEVSDTNIKNQLNAIRQNFLTEIEISGAIKSEEAAEEIKDVVEELAELEALLAASPSPINKAVQQLAEQAKFNLEQAQRSFEAGDYGRAFGQATSAQALVKNALRRLKSSTAEVEEEIQELKEDFDKLKAKAAEKGLTLENAAPLYELFTKAENKIAEILSNPSPVLIKEARTILSSIESIIESREEKKEKEEKEKKEKKEKKEENKNNDFNNLEEELEKLEKLEEELNKMENNKNNIRKTPQEWKIEIKEGQFNPSTLKIRKGDKVIWINTDGSVAWPASAVHPTHTVYPGSSIEKCGTAEAKAIFDACKNLAKGESWSFTFNEVGVWKYHNHLLAGARGTIEVEE